MQEILADLYRKRARLIRLEQRRMLEFQNAKAAQRAALRAWGDAEFRVAMYDHAIQLLEAHEQQQLEEETPPLTDAGVRPSAEIIKFGVLR